jgi:hypothetical protein
MNFITKHIFNFRAIQLFAIAFVCVTLVCFNVQAQNLTTDEKIQILSSGGHSIEMINFAALSDFTLPELEQANELKKLDIQDKSIINVLKSKAKYTHAEMVMLKEYETKGYSEVIIQKTIDEKPKFIKESELPKEPVAIAKTEVMSKEEVLPRNQVTGRISYEETVKAPRLTLEMINERAQFWMSLHLAPGERIGFISKSAFIGKGELYLEKEFTQQYKEWAVDQTVNFTFKFKCKNGEYTYQISDFTHGYNPGKTRITEQVEDRLAEDLNLQIKKSMENLINELKSIID